MYVFFLNCKKKTHYYKKNYYSTGELLSEIPYRISDSVKDGIYKEYYKNGQLKKIIYLRYSALKDSSFSYYETGEQNFREIRVRDSIFGTYFYKNGVVSATTKFLASVPLTQVGTSCIFYESGTIKDSLEYLKIDGKSYLNQKKHYNKFGEINKDSSYFYNFRISKINRTDRFLLKIDYEPKIKGSKIMLILGEEINDDFSNLKNCKLDTLKLNNKSISTDQLLEPYRKLNGLFYEYKIIRANEINGDSVRLKLLENKVFFKVHIKVADTLDYISS